MRDGHSFASVMAIFALASAVCVVPLVITRAAASASANQQASPTNVCAPTDLTAGILSGSLIATLDGPAFTIDVQNGGSSTCTLSGWPTLTAAATISGVTLTATEVTTSLLPTGGSVSSATVDLAPQSMASVSITFAEAGLSSACGTQLPVAFMPVPGGAPVSVASLNFGPCPGDLMLVTPFQLGTGATPVLQPGAPTLADQCPTSTLSVQLGTPSVVGTTTLVPITVTSADPQSCQLSNPASVTITDSAGSSLQAKAFPYFGKYASLLSGFSYSATTSSTITLSNGGSAQFGIILPQGGTNCPSLASISYSSDAGSSVVDLVAPQGVAMCSTAATSGSLQAASPPAAFVTPLTAGGTSLVTHVNASSGHVVPLVGDTPAGYYYGSDTSATLYTGSGVPYGEEYTGGAYGGYIGQVGGYWQDVSGCGSSSAYNTHDANAADLNASAGTGVGAQYYFFTGGPGVDPNYNGTTGEANNWGQLQGATADQDVASGSFPSNHAVILSADIEVGSGWDYVYSNRCYPPSGSSGSPTTQLNWDTFSTFYNYVYNNTPWFGAVYSTGNPNNPEWQSYMGSYGTSMTYAYEWAAGAFYSGSVSSSTGLKAWCVSGSNTCGEFFGGVSSSYELAWQWAIPTYGSQGDFDQFDTPNFP